MNQPQSLKKWNSWYCSKTKSSAWKIKNFAHTGNDVGEFFFAPATDFGSGPAIIANFAQSF
jgi:hypothetical protein